MRLRFVTALLLFTFLALVGCSSTSTPEKTVTDFYALIEAGKFDKAMKFLHIPEESKAKGEDTIIQGKFNIVMGEAKKQIDSRKGIKAIKVTESKLSEDGTRANLSMVIQFKDETEKSEHMKLIKVKDEWKIDL